jgi:alpha 1,2-mannosyltransferase
MKGKYSLVVRLGNIFFFKKTTNSSILHCRWSDAPVQTIAASMFLKKEEIKFFNEIGYTHSVATHCPYDETLIQKCSCDLSSNYGKYLLFIQICKQHILLM